MKDQTNRNNSANRSLPALVAVGGSLAAFPAAALELGDATVHSRLGQPLRASIAYALAPNEQVSDYCVATRPGASLSGLPGVGKTTIRVMNGVIMLAGQTIIREPMVSAHVVVNCPYSANLSREYMLFVDPASTVYEEPVVTQQAVVDAEPVVVALAAVVPSVRNAPVEKDIGASSQYRVGPGDSLSEITARIKDRPVGLWAAVDAIFKANPGAFINNDPNQLKAGSLLSIPSFGGNTAVIEGPTVVSDTPVTAATESTVETYELAATVLDAPAETILDRAPAVDNAHAGSIILDDNPFVEPATSSENIVIPDTQLEGPTTSSSNPNGSTAIIRTTTTDQGFAAPSWLLWLGGSGIALIIGLLMFGRRFRGSVDTTPLAPIEQTANRRRITDTESDTEQVEAIGVDYDLSDESPTEENLVLDADVIIGTGLSSGKDSSVSEDFGFAATTELDVELPFEPIAAASEETDILPPLRTDEHTILMSEVLPEEDDDYDMSVIVDATKMPRPEDVTERDLKAIEVKPEDETLISNNYTINKEVDYHVLEQDYEDEFTATQALNKEITRAAAELAKRMEDDEPDRDETMALPLASVTELDITAQMPAQNDDNSDLDDTVSEAITVNQTADESTVEMPVKSGKKS